MIEIKDTLVSGFEGAIEGMRFPMNSKGDSYVQDGVFYLGEKDFKLALNLANAGSDHGKFLRMIHVQTTIKAPSYWVAEHDTYKVATVRNSSSFMHKGIAERFEINKFDMGLDLDLEYASDEIKRVWCSVIGALNYLRMRYNDTKDIKWFLMIRKLLPSGWLIEYKWDANYQTLRTIYHQRKNHRLPEWKDFCRWIEGLPYSELITGIKSNEN